MNNQEPKSRVQRYNFNQGSDQPPRRRQRKPRRWWPWIMTLLTLAIAILLVLAINHHKTTGSSTSSSTSASSSVAAASSSASEQTAYERFRSTYSSYNDNGLTVTQKQKLQSIINDESNDAIQTREQNLLDQAKTKKSSAKTTSSSSAPQQSSSASSDSTFDSTHTFSSVNDAQNWAQASKQQWLQAGYSTYTITSDGHGNYNLKFVR